MCNLLNSCTLETEIKNTRLILDMCQSYQNNIIELHNFSHDFPLTSTSLQKIAVLLNFNLVYNKFNSSTNQFLACFLLKNIHLNWVHLNEPLKACSSIMHITRYESIQIQTPLGQLLRISKLEPLEGQLYKVWTTSGNKLSSAFFQWRNREGRPAHL